MESKGGEGQVPCVFHDELHVPRWVSLLLWVSSSPVVENPVSWLSIFLFSLSRSSLPCFPK